MRLPLKRFLRNTTCSFDHFPDILIATWSMMMVMRPPPSRSSLSTRPSRVLPRIKFYATLDYFLHFISQIKHICNFNIASLLIWSHQLRMHHPGTGYIQRVCLWLSSAVDPVSAPAHHVWSWPWCLRGPGCHRGLSRDLMRAIRDYCGGTGG